MKWLPFIVIFAATPLLALYTGSDFVDECGRKTRDSELFCNGVVYTYLKIIEDKQICYRLSDTTTLGDLREEIVSFVEAHPMASEAKASLLIIQSLTTRYPCHVEWPKRTALTPAPHNKAPQNR